MNKKRMKSKLRNTNRKKERSQVRAMAGWGLVVSRKKIRKQKKQIFRENVCG